MFVSLHRLNDEGHQTLETLATDPVRRVPDHNQRIDGLPHLGGPRLSAVASSDPREPLRAAHNLKNPRLCRGMVTKADLSGLRALGKGLRRRKRTHEQKDGRKHGEIDA